MKIYWTKINEIIEESPEVKTYMLDTPQDFSWEEGSFTHFAMKEFNSGEKPNKGLVRHMSICTLPEENSIGITTRIREQCSEFKSVLRNLEIGDEVALFKTRSNVPLKRENKNIYLLSSGVGLATFRPLVLDYFKNNESVKQVHSLNIESSREFLFTDIFTTSAEKRFISEFVDNRPEYYSRVKELAADKNGIFYVVGSDEFLVENIKVLREHGIEPEQIMLDKHESNRSKFISVPV